MKYFSFLIVAGALFFSACKGGNNSPKSGRELMEEAAGNMNMGAGKFSIETPKDWRRTDTSLNGIKTTLLLSNTVAGGFRSNINVITEKMGNNSTEQYFDKAVSTMGQYLEKFTVVGKGDKDINGVPSKWVKYTAEQGGKNVSAILYIVPKNGIAYGITGICNAGEEEKDFPVFEQTAASFKVTE